MDTRDGYLCCAVPVTAALVGHVVLLKHTENPTSPFGRGKRNDYSSNATKQKRAYDKLANP